jgi:hypothetical protein
MPELSNGGDSIAFSELGVVQVVAARCSYHQRRSPGSLVAPYPARQLRSACMLPTARVSSIRFVSKVPNRVLSVVLSLSISGLYSSA